MYDINCKHDTLFSGTVAELGMGVETCRIIAPFNDTTIYREGFSSPKHPILRSVSLSLHLLIQSDEQLFWLAHEQRQQKNIS
jgi:hypothetical protein